MKQNQYINFDPITKTKSSSAMCGFRSQSNDLEPLDIMCYYCYGCKAIFTAVITAKVFYEEICSTVFQYGLGQCLFMTEKKFWDSTVFSGETR